MVIDDFVDEPTDTVDATVQSESEAPSSGPMQRPRRHGPRYRSINIYDLETIHAEAIRSRERRLRSLPRGTSIYDAGAARFPPGYHGQDHH